MTSFGISFRQGRLAEHLKIQLGKIKSETESYDSDQLLNISEYDFVKYCIETFTICELELNEDGITQSIDDKQDKSFHIRYQIPFTGDPEIASKQPEGYAFTQDGQSMMMNGNEFNFSAICSISDIDNVKRQFQIHLDLLRSNVNSTNQQIRAFNSRLEEEALTAIKNQKQWILKVRDIKANLEYPLHVRTNSSVTYIAPVKRKHPILKPKVSPEPFKAEPVLENAVYEQILELLERMNLVVERSPKAFEKMNEESLRHLLLVILNSHFEGSAAGEQFNFEGKTDILIRVEDRNIFIAECKFWNGQQCLLDAIDQFLKYATWRDTKLALIIFNRRKNLSRVLSGIPSTVESHPNYKRTIELNKETAFRYVIHHKDDPQRELILSVLVFEVPASHKERDDTK